MVNPATKFEGTSSIAKATSALSIDRLYLNSMFSSVSLSDSFVFSTLTDRFSVLFGV